jgi:hypothetical protein
MTSNTTYLADVLGKRIAQRETSSQDLLLLGHLLSSVQRRGLLLGAGAGVAVALVLQSLALLMVG